MAILLACHWGYPMDEVLSGMDTSRVYPNKLILSLGESVLNLAPGVITMPVFERLEVTAPQNPPLPVFKACPDGVYQMLVG